MTGILLRSMLFLATIGVAASTGQATRVSGDESGKQVRFERFKQLAGDWVAKGGGEEVQVKYKVTSGGTAVVETISPGTDHEMITVIHPDGDSLLLTHYCMLGNQPQMKAAGSGDGNQVAFKFLRATNLTSEKAPHMHNVTYTFVDKDALKTEWTMYQDGKPG